MANKIQLAILNKGTEVWNAWRGKQPDDLVVDLTNANLEGKYLRTMNLKDVNLTSANLINANLMNANLEGANLTSANLRRANLEGALLKHASLRDTYLTLAILRETNLDSAALSGAIFRETIFANTNLSNASGLEDANHFGPSTLDHRTIEKSGRLPINFLRGCGWPESLIEYLPALLTQPISFYSCFISYCHADKVFARRLHDQLQGRGIRCWLDEHQLLPGDDIYEQIDQGIKLWDKVLLCASKDSLTSWWVDNEIDAALRKEQQLMKQRKYKVWTLIPLNLDGYLFSEKWERGLAGQVKSRLAADFIGWGNENNIFEQAFEHVVNALKTDGAGREPAPDSKL